MGKNGHCIFILIAKCNFKGNEASRGRLLGNANADWLEQFVAARPLASFSNNDFLSYIQ